MGWVAGPLANKELKDSSPEVKLNRVAKGQCREQELWEADLRVS